MKRFYQAAIIIAMATLSFTSCEDVPEPYNFKYKSNESTNVNVDPEGDGKTIATAYNVAAALQLINSGTYTSDKVYIKGVINQIDNIDTGTYGNAIYYIADKKGNSTQLEIYRGYDFGNKHFTASDAIKVGDEVVIKGVLTLYKTKPQVAQGSYIASLNGKSSEGTNPSTPAAATPKGSGTQADPYNVAKALQQNISSTQFFVKGIIASVKGVNTQYGNAEYFISDDGKNANTLHVFRGLFLNKAKFTSADQIKVGDEVLVCGNMTEYNGNKQLAQGSYIVTLKSNGSSSGTTGSATTTTEGIKIDGTTVTFTNKNVTAGTTTVTVDLNAIGLADGADVTTVTLSDGATITFDANGQSNGPKFYAKTKGVRVYANNKFTINGKAKIAKVVIQCDTFNGTNYVGNNTATVTFSDNDAIYTNVFTGTSGGGVQLRVQKLIITYAQ